MVLNKKLFLCVGFLFAETLFAPPPFNDKNAPNHCDAKTTPTLLCVNPATGEKFVLFCFPIKTEGPSLDGNSDFMDEFVIPECDDQVVLIDDHGSSQIITFQNPELPPAEEPSFELVEISHDPFLEKLNTFVASSQYYFERSLRGNLIVMDRESGQIAELSQKFFFDHVLKTIIWSGKKLFCFTSNLFYGAIKTAEFSKFISILLRAYMAGNLHFE